MLNELMYFKIMKSDFLTKKELKIWLNITCLWRFLDAVIAIIQNFFQQFAISERIRTVNFKVWRRLFVIFRILPK